MHAGWTIAISYFQGMNNFIDPMLRSEQFTILITFMITLVPLVLLGQMLFEFVWVPVVAMVEENPDIPLISWRFWRIFIFEGGYGFHVKDATPMDHFARFEAMMASGAGETNMQKSATALAKERYPAPAVTSVFKGMADAGVGVGSKLDGIKKTIISSTTKSATVVPSAHLEEPSTHAVNAADDLQASPRG